MKNDLPLTKYHQIYLVLREKVLEGAFDAGLPPELRLAEEFGVGRVTMRRALEQLVSDGLIYRVSGKGSWPTATREGHATPPVAQVASAPLSGLMQNIISANRQTTVKVLEWSTVSAAPAVAQALMLPVGTPVRKAVRTRSTREGPLSYITTYVPESLGASIARRQLASTAMLQLIQDQGVQLGRARQSISAQHADATVASHLGVAIGSALLSVRRQVFDVNDRPVQLLLGLYRPERYEYQIEVSQVGMIDAKISVHESDANDS